MHIARASVSVVAFLLIFPVATTLCAAAAAADRPASAPAFRTYQHPVTTWVAPYAVEKSKVVLVEQPGIPDALTHLALQFWVPTESGGVELVKKHEATEA